MPTMADRDEAKTGEPGSAKATGRRWFLGITIAAGALGGLFALWRLVFRVWMGQSVPDDAPRIAFSLDATWLNQLGITKATYEQAMTRAKGRLVTLEPSAAGSPRVDAGKVGALLDKLAIDGVLLTGGGDVDPELYGGDPERATMVNRLRDDFEIALIREARGRNLPILGVCRGCQIMNVAFGGTLRSLRDEEDREESHFTLSGHDVELVPGSTLAELLGVTRLEGVYSFHGQAVEAAGTGVTVTATDDSDVVEGIEVDGDNAETWMIGVQWHPEMTVADEIQSRLFKGFCERADVARARRLSARTDVP